MKKILLSILGTMFFCGMATQVNAQELTQTRKTATFAPGMLTSPVSVNTRVNIQKRLPKHARTTILRFEAGQTELSEVQKELLLRIADRLKEREGQSLTVIVASTDANDSGHRARNIQSFLRSYVQQFQYTVRYVKPENVVGSVNNTVKIIEQR